MKVLHGTLLAGASTLALSLVWLGNATAETITLDGSAGKTSYTNTRTLAGGNGKAGSSGVQGAGGSGDWSSAIRVTGTNITVDVAAGSVTGGTGGKGGDAASSYNGGGGGNSYGINVKGDRASVTIGAGATVSGGTGGTGGNGYNGGNGGETAGLLLYGNDATVVNQGTIQAGTSGTGGKALTPGGNDGHSLGSSAVRIGLGVTGVTGYVGDRNALTNGGSILGRNGNGIDVYSANTTITNTGTIATDTGQAAILLNPGSGITRITNRGSIVNTAAYDKDSRWAIGNFGAGAEITNYGTIKSQSYDASAVSSTKKTSVVNYGAILGGIDTSAQGDTLTFDGSQGGATLSGGVWGNTDETNPTHATITVRNGITEFVSAQGIDAAYDHSTRLRIGSQPVVTFSDLNAVTVTASNTVTIAQGGELALSANALINSDKGFTNNGVFALGRRIAVIGGSVRDNPDGTVTILPGGAVSGTGVITTKVGSGQHGYIIATANRADDFSKMTVVPVVEGTGVKNGSTYVLVQNYAGTAAAPAVTKAGGFLWSSAVQTASGQVDSDGVSYGTANSSIIISASANELIAGAAGTNGAPVRALAAYMGPNVALAALSQAVNSLSSEAEVRKAGAQLRPEANGATAQAAMGAVNQALTTVQVRSDAVRTAMAGETGIATGDAPLTVGVWGQAFGSTATQGRRNGVDGYGSNTYGVAFGADGMVTDAVLTGVSLAYARTRVDDSGARTGSGQDIDSWIASLYGTYSAPSWYVDGALTLGWHAYDSTRVVNFAGIQPQTARASYNGFQYGAKAEVGVPLAVAGSTTVTPLASLAFSRLRQDGYTETGAPGANLAVEGTSTNSLKSGLGAKVSLGALPAGGWTLTPTARAVWLHEFSSSAPDQTASFTAAATPFTTAGTSPARDHANLGVGLDAALSGQITLSARYDADLAQSYVGHSGSLQLRVTF